MRKILLPLLMLVGIILFAGCQQEDPYQFKTGELENYVIVYANDNPDYFELANKLLTDHPIVYADFAF